MHTHTRARAYVGEKVGVKGEITKKRTIEEWMLQERGWKAEFPSMRCVSQDRILVCRRREIKERERERGKEK